MIYNPDHQCKLKDKYGNKDLTPMAIMNIYTWSTEQFPK